MAQPPRCSVEQLIPRMPSRRSQNTYLCPFDVPNLCSGAPRPLATGRNMHKPLNKHSVLSRNPVSCPFLQFTIIFTGVYLALS